MHALVILPENSGTNPGLDDLSWSTDNPSCGFLGFSFLMDPNFLPFVVRYLLLDVPNMHEAHRFTSSFKSRNIDGRTPSFACLNMDLGWGRENL